MKHLKVATIGFTQSSAENFFNRIKGAGISRVVDVRLHNTSQLAGFAKADDLAYFLRELCNVEYTHEPLLAPTEEIMSDFRKKKNDWQVFRERFLGLMAERQIENRLKPALFNGACLLCAEARPHHCHRQFVCEYLNDKWGGRLDVTHL